MYSCHDIYVWMRTKNQKKLYQTVTNNNFSHFMLLGLDTCSRNCSHFHQCDSLYGYYRCTCEKGFTSYHCNINIDDCSPNPCVHGKCVDGVDSFECACETGYWGTFCENRITVQKGRNASS